MKTITVPAMILPARCQFCGNLSTFPVFESGFGEFEAFFGNATGTFYRLDLNRTSVRYGATAREDALEPAITREGGLENLRRVPEELSCQKCGNKGTHHVPELGNGHEEMIAVVELPVAGAG
jgi:hypothetical protein